MFIGSRSGHASRHKSRRPLTVSGKRRRRRTRGYFERLEERNLLAVDVLAPLVDGFVTDTNKDGTFPDLNSTGTDIRVRDYPNSAGYPGDDRGVLEFDTSGIGAGLTVDSAEFGLQRRSSYGGNATVDVFAYAADGVLTAGDATASATLVGTVVMDSASSYSVSLDASTIQSIYDSSNHIGIRLAIASTSSGFGFGMYSTEGTPESLPEYAPSLTLTTSGTPVPSLKVTLDPAAVAENAGNSAVTGTVERLNADTSADLTVALSTNDATEAAPAVPNVTILAGSATANFDVDVFDDDVLDGGKSVSITATAAGILDGDASLLVTDYETLSVTAADASVVESAGTGATTVTITRSNTDISAPFAVTLTDTNPRLSVPASATILANETSVTVPVDVIDTEIVDGNATVLVKANATGYQQGQTTIVVEDDDSGQIRPGNILVAVENRYVKEYKPDGTLIQTFIAFPQDSGAGGQFRDVVVNDQGDIEVINANSTLSNIDVETKAVTNHTDPDWSTGGNLTTGGVARLGQYLYVNDVGTTRGVIRFDTLNGYATTRVNTTYDIHDVTIGLDGKLYALESGGSGDDVAVINPLTMQILDNIKLQFTTHRGIAVNAAGEIFATGWQESIYKYDSQGNLIDFFATGWELDDIDIDSTGRIVAAGDAFSLSHKYVVMTDEKFQTVSYFPVTDDNELFVAFADPDTTAVTPVLTTSGTPTTLTENGTSAASTSVIIDPGLTLTDDGDVMTGAVIRITDNYVKGQDSLSAFSQNFIVAQPFDSKTGTITLSGTASVANYQTALRSVQYRNSSNSPDTNPRTITFSAIDEGWAGNGNATVQVVSSNDGLPVANDDSYTVNQDGVLQLVPVTLDKLTLQSDTGEFVGQGQSYNLSGNLSIGQQFGTTGARFNYDDGNLDWSLTFWADSGPIAVGSYPVATDFGSNGTARLDISGNGRASSRHFGSFDVHEVEFDGSTLIRFAASFVQYTSSKSPALRGTIDYRSTHTTESGVIINDTDTDGGRLTVTGTTTPANGSVVMQTNGVFEYTPDSGFFGLDSFDYTLQDSDGATTTATATIDVTPAPGFTVTGTPLNVAESGTTDTFDVVLNVQPASDVVLIVTSNDTTEATVDPATLTFTPANWDIAQTVTVTGVDDSLDDGDQTKTIKVSVDDAASDDAFDPLGDRVFNFTTLDDDTAGFTVTETGGTAVSELESGFLLRVVLDAEPASNVVFNVTSSDTSEATVNVSTLTFTPANWNTVQSVVVSGVDDSIVDGDQSSVITISVNDAASDDMFDPLADSTTNVTTSDNDAAVLTIGDASVTEGQSGTKTLSFPVSLSREADVEVKADYRTVDGSATTADGDYVGVTTPVTLTIPVGGTTGQIDITVNGDTSVEANETLEVMLSNLRASGRNVRLGTTLFADDFDDEASADPPGGWTLVNDDGLALETSATNSVRLTSGPDGQTRIVSSGLPTFNPQATGEVSLTLEVDSLTGTGNGGVFIDGAVLAFISSSTNMSSGNVFKIFLQYDGDLYAGARNGQGNENVLLGTLAGYSGGPVDITASLTSSGFRFTTDTGFDSGFHAYSTFFTNGFTYADLGSTAYGVLYSFLNADSNVGRIAVNTGSTGIGTIVNDEVGSLSFDANVSSAGEGTATHGVDVRLNLAQGATLSAPVSVDVVDLLSGTSATPADYGYAAQTVTFNPGDGDGTIRSVSLSVVDDPNVEGDETVELGLSKLVDGTGGQITLAGAGGSQTFSRLVDEDGFVRDSDGDGTFETSFGTTGNDLRTAKLQPPRAEERSLLETDISSIPANATVVSATLSLTTYFTSSGLEPGNIDLLGYAGDGVLVTADATASANVVGTVTIPRGVNTTYAIPLSTSFVQSLIGTSNFLGIATRTDQDESISFHSTESGQAFPAQKPTLEIVYTSPGHTVTINDDDTATVAFALAASSVSESVASGSHDVTVNLSIPSGGTLAHPVSVNFRNLGSGTADSGDFNFNTSPKTVTFAAGSSAGSQVVSIAILDDLHVEGDDTIETDLNNLADGTNGQVSIGTPGAHTVTILDDDVATISFVSSSSSVGESAGTHSVDVKLDIPGGGSLLRTISADVKLNAAAPGTATEDSDYNIAAQTVTFFVAPFESTKSVTLDVLADSLLEGDETVNLILANLVPPTGALVSLAAPTSHEVTVIDDESAQIVFEVAASSAGESGGAHDVTLRLVAAAGVTVAPGVTLTADVVDLGTGAASSGTDYSAFATQTVNFGSGSGNGATQTVSLNVLEDLIDEAGEDVDLSIESVTGPSMSIGGQSTHEVTIADNDTAGIVVSAISNNTTEEGADATFTVVLSSEPTANVSIGLSSSDTTEGTVSPASLTFTTANWNTAQTVTVTGEDDLLVDGDIAYTIVLAAASSSDSLYDGLDPTDISATNLDNDVPLVFSYSPLSGALVAGGTSYTTGLEPTAEPFNASDLQATDGVAQSITEGEALVGGSKKPKKSSAIDYYQWSFGVVADATAFSLDAWRDANAEGDSFRFEYSLGGGAWTALATVSSATSQSYDVDLSATPLNGNLVLRVVDTDRSPVNRRQAPSLDSVHVDAVSFDSLITDLRPRVNVMATDATAAESPLDNGQFTLEREGTIGDLQVFYTVSGSATAGTDYVTLTGAATIPDGQTSTTITVTPFDDSDAEGNETVIVTLTDDDSHPYKPGAGGAATVTITDDDLQIFTATTENTVSGSVIANSYTATADADGVVEIIQERQSGGKKANRTSFVDHRWTFTGVSSAESFYVTASRPNNSEGEDFTFQLSIDGGSNWTHLATVSTPSLTLYPVALPSAISGTVQVRVIDTDPNTAGNNGRDTINIDQMYFSSAPLAPLVADTTVFAARGRALTRAELASTSQRAIEYWRQQEVHFASSATEPITFEIVQMATPYLGLAHPARNLIQIDIDAGGFGWNRADLFSTVLHEIGHLYGHDHDELGESLTIGRSFETTSASYFMHWLGNNKHQGTRTLLPESRSVGNDSDTGKEGRRSAFRQHRQADTSDRMAIRSLGNRRGTSDAVLVDELFAGIPQLQLDDDLTDLLARSQSEA